MAYSPGAFPCRTWKSRTARKLTVRESQMAAFVNEGRMADVLGPGLYTLNTNTLPLLTNLMNWDKLFQSPFKTDVYFFSSRLQTNQRWGTAQPITIRDKDFGAVRLRAFGIYSWRLDRSADVPYEGQRHARALPRRRHRRPASQYDRRPHVRHVRREPVPFLDMAANQVELASGSPSFCRPRSPNSV